MRVFTFIFDIISDFIDTIIDLFDTWKDKETNFKWKILFTIISIVLFIVGMEISRRIWL